MSKEEMDKRFSRFKTDPKFRSLPKKDKKVKIDERFQGMFKDKRFNNKVSVDKRGRPQNFVSSDNYKKYYSVDDDDDEENEDDEDKSRALPNMDIDYARGEGILIANASSSSSSSSEEEEGESESDEEDERKREQGTFDKWGELDHDAERCEDIVSHRLALCNMDWDRVGAKDIYLAMSSFCPPGANVKSVKIYLSQFGKERLTEEEKLGPLELRQAQVNSSDEEDLNQEDIDKLAMDRVRQYQISRLKYYYAVIEFDKKETADAVYKECDGLEYELSASRFDLRFIPEEVTFEDDEPTEVCDSMPDLLTYKPKVFFTTALQQGKVELTWDETDPKRIAAMRRAFEEEDFADVDDNLKAYLAVSSSDKDNDDDDDADEEKDEDLDDTVEKYKALLAEIKKDKNHEAEKGNMEISWNNEQSNKKDDDSLTPWEKYLNKKKEKMKSKREKNKKKETECAAFSDDELPSDVELSDPFFKRETKRSEKSKRQPQSSEDDKGLELLVMESDDEKEHFDYKDIIKKESKKKKKKTKKIEGEDKEDNFKIDLSDERFAAIFDNANYNVDPSHPNFKKTKSMKTIISEKQKRILRGDLDSGSISKRNKPSSSSEIDKLVKSVKMKAKFRKLNNK